MHWESYLLLQDLKKEKNKNKKNVINEIICDFSLGVGSVPEPVVKASRQPSVLHGSDYLGRSLVPLSVTVKEDLISAVSTGFWSPVSLDWERERRLHLLGGKCFCSTLS